VLEKEIALVEEVINVGRQQETVRSVQAFIVVCVLTA
jgi:hypothetical protein